MKLSTFFFAMVGVALHTSVCAQMSSQIASPFSAQFSPSAERKTEPPTLLPPATVVLPTALQHESKVGWTLALGQGRRLRLGLLSGRAALSEALPSASSTTQRTLAGLEYEQRMGAATGNIKFGALRQSNALLGRGQNDTSPWNIATRTNFSSMSLAYPVASSVSLVGMLSFGRTSSAPNAAALGQMRPASAAAASIGLSAGDMLRTGDRAGLALVMPTRGAGVASVDGAPAAPRGLALGMRYGFAF